MPDDTRLAALRVMMLAIALHREILVEAPFQSGAELRAIGETVGVALPPERMLYLPA